AGGQRRLERLAPRTPARALREHEVDARGREARATLGAGQRGVHFARSLGSERSRASTSQPPTGNDSTGSAHRNRGGESMPIAVAGGSPAVAAARLTGRFPSCVAAYARRRSAIASPRRIDSTTSPSLSRVPTRTPSRTAPAAPASRAGVG